METEDIDKILSKSYAELSGAEKEAIQEICSSEEEFVQLQQFFASVESYARETQEDSLPSAETKDKLDDLFHQTYQGKGILWYNSLWASLYPAEKRFDQRPLVRIAAILVVLLSIVPFLNGPETKKATLVASKNVVKEKNEQAPQAGQQETTAKAAKAQWQELSGNSAHVTEVSPVLIAALEQRVDQEASFGEVADYRVEVKDASVYDDAVSYSVTPLFAHPDGIFMDTFSYSDNFQLNQNLAVLDLLTPTF